MKNIICFILLVAGIKSYAQQPAFYNDIQAFKLQDSLTPPPEHPILFVGSSSFTKWTDVQSYFPGYTILNRGFGGSSLPDVINYAGDIIIPYQPKEIVIYCGENDFAGDSTVSSETVFNRFKTLFQIIRNQLKDVPVAFISIKPSPSRRRYWDKMIMANAMIKRYLATQQNTSFIDVYKPMLNENHQPKPEIFLSDSLHMNEKGYAIWQKAIEPYLIK